MSNLVGKVASFTFVAHLVKEVLLFLVFNMALAAILDLKVKIVPKHIGYYSIRSLVPKFVENDILCLFGQSGLRDITLSYFQYCVGDHFEKWAFRIFSRHFWELHGAYISSNRFILSNQLRNKGSEKMVTDPRKMTLLLFYYKNLKRNTSRCLQC